MVGMATVLTLRDRALQSRDAIELLSSKWRVTIIHLLRDAALRTSEVQGAIPDVSPKVLTETLRGMERDGLIERRVLSAVPARVEYELTPMGYSLIAPLQELCHWAKVHVAERDAARQRFDQAALPAVRMRRVSAPGQ
jgi:DNA-binding HxlR family transcriptional regulator